MSARHKLRRRDRHTSRTTKHLLALAARYKKVMFAQVEHGARASGNCDECCCQPPRHNGSEFYFYQDSYYEGGVESDWCVCGDCFPMFARKELSDRNYNNRKINRVCRHFDLYR